MPDQELDITLDEENNLDIDIEPGIIEVPTGDIVHVNPTAVWNSTPQLIAKSKHIYVYSDYTTASGEDVPGIKIGDGKAYLIDLPFTDEIYTYFRHDNPRDRCRQSSVEQQSHVLYFANRLRAVGIFKSRGGITYG